MKTRRSAHKEKASADRGSFFAPVESATSGKKRFGDRF